MGTVSKGDLIKDVATRASLSMANAKMAVDSLLDVVRDRAEQGDTIRLLGFGSFSVKARPARTARNPRTGEAVDVPESRKLTFKAAKA